MTSKTFTDHLAYALSLALFIGGMGYALFIASCSTTPSPDVEACYAYYERMGWDGYEAEADCND